MSPWEGADYVLPGDEKAGGTGEAPGKGAPSPMTAQEVKKADEAKAAPPPTPKTTESPAQTGAGKTADQERSEEHTSELQSPMRIAYDVFCLKQKTNITTSKTIHQTSQQ